MNQVFVILSILPMFLNSVPNAHTRQDGMIKKNTTVGHVTGSLNVRQKVWRVKPHREKIAPHSVGQQTSHYAFSSTQVNLTQDEVERSPAPRATADGGHARPPPPGRYDGFGHSSYPQRWGRYRLCYGICFLDMPLSVARILMGPMCSPTCSRL